MRRGARPVPVAASLVVALASLLVAATARASAGAAADSPASASSLSPVALDALRRAAWALEPDALRQGGIGALVDRAAAFEAELTSVQRRAIRSALEADPLLRLHVAEILEVGGTWRRLSGERVVVYWPPGAVRSGEVVPPSRSELRRLDAIVRGAAERFGLEPPEAIPVRLAAGVRPPRVFPRSDVRWGVVGGRPTPDGATEPVPVRVEPSALVRVVLAELGDLPALQQAVGVLHGDCFEDRACRDERLEAARRVVVSSGHVPFADALRAAHLSGPDDPALASLLLSVDHLERRVAPRSFAALMGRLTPESSGAELWQGVVAAFGEAPAKIDREVLRDLRAWGRAQRP